LCLIILKNNVCKYDEYGAVANVAGYVQMPAGDEEFLREAVAAIGPISVAIDASSTTFQFYKGGIYDEKKCSDIHLNHAVLLVGYGSDIVGKDYWIVKNSWGTSWGEEGYIRMSRNNNNQCGIATESTYPIFTPVGN